MVFMKIENLIFNLIKNIFNSDAIGNFDILFPFNIYNRILNI
jgi:hypothetical protein